MCLQVLEEKKDFICAFKREGEVLETEDVAQRIYVPTWRNRKKRKEKKKTGFENIKQKIYILFYVYKRLNVEQFEKGKEDSVQEPALQ